MLDQFGGSLGDIYEGAQIAEVLGGVTYGFYNNLSSSGKYLDPVGAGSEGDIVDAGSTVAATWYAQPMIPMSAKTTSQNIPVKVDGFTLNPSIVNRVWTTTPPNTLTITWPN